MRLGKILPLFVLVFLFCRLCVATEEKIPVSAKEYETAFLQSKNPQTPIYRYNRLLELSLFYAGYSEDIFLKLDYYIPPDTWNMSPPKEIEGLRRGMVRNAQKAMKYAEMARDVSPNDMRRIADNLLLSYEFEGIGTERRFGVMYDYEKRYDVERAECISKYNSALEKYGRNLPRQLRKVAERMVDFINIKDLPNAEKYNPEKAGMWYAYRIYVHYRGAFGFEMDLKKVRDYIYMSRPTIWLNFYTGFLVPRDEELAEYILKVQDTNESRKILKKIKGDGK